MRPITLLLNVLIREFVNDNPWPGVEETINLNDAACPSIDGDKPVFKVEQGFVAFEGGSLPGPIDESGSAGLETGWNYYTNDQAKDLIPIWEMFGFEWHAATKIYCSNNLDNFWVVSDNFFDVFASLTVCCGAPNIQSAGFVFKMSTSPLTPGEQYLCPIAASFKWLAVRSQTETRNLEYKFLIELTTMDDSTTLDNNGDPGVTFLNTLQVVRAWPQDFIGLVLDGITLVDNGSIPGVNEKRVGDFDLGTIKMTTIITDTDTLEVVSTVEEEFALPESCGIFEESFSLEFE